jgi:glycosyltransferase involved in cell wall biosynthesis
LAPPFECIPPRRYGSIGRVIATLADALVLRGHEVLLFASGDSETAATLVPTTTRSLCDDERFRNILPFWAIAAGRAYAHTRDLDVMLNHLDYFAFPAARLAPIPTVTTLHERLDLAEFQPLYEEYADQRLVSVSDAQRFPLAGANWVGTVHHGLATGTYQLAEGKGRYLAYCGRFLPEKGAARAIQIAREAGLPLKLAGPMPREAQRSGHGRREHDYFDAEIRPNLGGDVEYVGEVSDADKQQFFGSALALIFPVAWPEPFGLVAIEALACGTPIVATAAGALPEIVQDGVTGFLCQSNAQFCAAIERTRSLDRRSCRSAFEERFSAPVMARGYEQVCERVLGAS